MKKTPDQVTQAPGGPPPTAARANAAPDPATAARVAMITAALDRRRMALGIPEGDSIDTNDTGESGSNESLDEGIGQLAAGRALPDGMSPEERVGSESHGAAFGSYTSARAHTAVRAHDTPPPEPSILVDQTAPDGPLVPLPPTDRFIPATRSGARRSKSPHVVQVRPLVLVGYVASAFLLGCVTMYFIGRARENVAVIAPHASAAEPPKSEESSASTPTTAEAAHADAPRASTAAASSSSSAAPNVERRREPVLAPSAPRPVRPRAAPSASAFRHSDLFELE